MAVPTSYLNQNISLGNLKFGVDSISQTLSRAARNHFDPAKYENLQKVPLPSDTLFQILEITDVTRSLQQELEYLNEFDDEQNVVTDKVSNSKKGQKKKIITNVNLDNQQQEQQSVSKSLYKLLLQDCMGNLSYAIELDKLNFLKSSQDKFLVVPLGSKMIVKLNTVILRGCLMLANKDCMFIGGQLPDLNYNYLKRRIQQLQTQIDAEKKQ